MDSGDHILIVDPDRDLVRSLQQVLSRHGFRSSAVHDGEEALKLCEKSLPRMLILEGLLPKLSGIELAKRVRAMPNGGLVSILLISSVFSGSKFRDQIAEAQIDDILAKPFAESHVLAKVRSLEIELNSRLKESAADGADAFTPAGFVSDTPFIRLVFHLRTRKETGTLRLQSGDTKKLVTFEGGEPRFVVSNLERECLGQLLVKRGRLSEEELKRSLDLMAALKKRQGEALIQLGLLEPYELEDALKQQAREKFCELFSWRHGKYLFVAGKVFRKELTPVDLSVPQLCLRGVKEHYALSTLEGELTPFRDAPPELRPDPPFAMEDFKFATWDMRIVAHLRRRKTIRQILESRAARDIDVYHLVFTLMRLECLGFPGVSEAMTTRTVEEVTVEREVPPADSPFELLGVSPTADDDEIRVAFEKKMAAAGGHSQENPVVSALRKALVQIGTYQGRRDYLFRVYEEEGALIEGAREIFKPAELLVIGKRFLDRNRMDRASRVFSDGIGLFPDYGLFFTFIGWCIFRQALADSNAAPDLESKARKALVKGAQMASDEEESHLYLGRFFSIKEEYENAVKEFRRTLDIKPEHREAASEMRLAQMRAEKHKSTSFIKWKR